MIYSAGDAAMYRNFIETGQASDTQKRIEHQKLNALLGLCEAVTCRRQIILDYFGDNASLPCGNCDNCKNKPESFDGIKPRSGSREQLLLIKEKYLYFKKKNYLIADAEPSYYLYQQEKWGRKYTGIIAAISIDDYFNGNIKLHEQTLTEKENKLKEYLEICDFNAEPVSFS
jgi:superfamily II DNA helicase RecQ